jgi:hypothetical protein
MEMWGRRCGDAVPIRRRFSVQGEGSRHRRDIAGHVFRQMLKHHTATSGCETQGAGFHCSLGGVIRSVNRGLLVSLNPKRPELPNNSGPRHALRATLDNRSPR